MMHKNAHLGQNSLLVESRNCCAVYTLFVAFCAENHHALPFFIQL